MYVVCLSDAYLLDIGCGYRGRMDSLLPGIHLLFLLFHQLGTIAISLGPLISLQAHVLLISLVEQKQQAGPP